MTILRRLPFVRHKPMMHREVAWKISLGITLMIFHTFQPCKGQYKNSFVAKDSVMLDSLLRNMDLDPDMYKNFHAPIGEFKTKTLKKTSYPNPKYRTTKHLKELFIGRCFEYQFKRDIHQEKSWNCDELWKLFSKAFAHKGPCDVKQSDYEDFLNRIDEDLPKDKVLLWSGSREAAHKYSDFEFTRRFTTLEDTLAGYIVNNLKWCGSKEDLGINFKECPWECSIQPSYWSLANKKFAKKIRGVVHILLNGTRQHLDDKKIYPSYMKNRYYLGPHIIPEFRKDKITKVVIIVGHTLHRNSLESCGEKTVQLLVNDIKEKEIPVECHNDTAAIKHIICVDDPLTKGCSLEKK